MVYDNRFFPLYKRNYTRTCERQSAVMVDGFIMSGNKAFSEGDSDDSGIYEVFGKYDQWKVAEALIATGSGNPFINVPGIDPNKYIGQEILWTMDGKIQSQGVAIQWDQYLCKYVSIGCSWFFMHLFSRNNFLLPQTTIEKLGIMPEEAIRLDQIRRNMNKQLGLEPAKNDIVGSSDLDPYIRLGGVWDYTVKFKRIDAGVRFGGLIPTGKIRNIFNPASLPFGGDGKWGIYASLDIQLDLKHDWIVGAVVRFNQRFEQNQLQRVPVVGEQPLYAASIDRVHIEPGFTFIFTPYFQFDHLRSGFGIGGQYTMVIHRQDDWTIQNPANNFPEKLANVVGTSDWRAEYLTVDAFYDFAKVGLTSCYVPIVSVKWDIPVKLFLAKGIAKTNRLSIGVHYDF